MSRRKKFYGGVSRKDICHLPKINFPKIKKPRKLIDLVPSEIKPDIEGGVKMFRYMKNSCCECLDEDGGILICGISRVKMVRALYESDYPSNVNHISRSNPSFQAIVYPEHFTRYCLKKNGYKNCFTYINNPEERKIFTQKFNNLFKHPKRG